MGGGGERSRKEGSRGEGSPSGYSPVVLPSPTSGRSGAVKIADRLRWRTGLSALVSLNKRTSNVFVNIRNLAESQVFISTLCFWEKSANDHLPILREGWKTYKH